MPTFRVSIDTPSQLGTAILSYARAGFEIHLRSTRRYGEESDPPYLYQNSPLLLAVARLPLMEIDDPIVAVLDAPGMTTQRSPRDREVADLIESLHAVVQNGGCVTYGAEPVEWTSELAVDVAAEALSAGAAVPLTADSTRRLLSLLRWGD